MSRLLILALCLFPQIAVAGGAGTYHGYAAPYEWSIEPLPWYSQTWGKLWVFTKTKTHEYDITSECTFPDTDQREPLNAMRFAISCKGNGKSPLAGTTYKVKKVPKNLNCDKLIFVCTSGCRSEVPKKFVFDPECEG